MLYKRKSFSVPATNGDGDCSQGHAMPDSKGKCVRCGEATGALRVPHPIELVPMEAAVDASGFENHIPWIREHGVAFQNVVMHRKDLGANGR